MILDKIVSNKKQELEEVKRKTKLQDLQAMIDARTSVRSFKKALQEDGVSLIAEVKRASPSAGIIREDFDPVQIARAYQSSGVAAISVLTEEKFFSGNLKYLNEIRQVVSLPLLRKDFIFDTYQIYESRAFGADAVLLIASVLSRAQMDELLALAGCLCLDALVEVHTEEELDHVLQTNAQIIGINNRNLKTFEVDIATTARLAKRILADTRSRDKVIVSESGIKTRKDVDFLADAGADAILVGEALMRGDSIEKKVGELLKK